MSGTPKKDDVINSIAKTFGISKKAAKPYYDGLKRELGIITLSRTDGPEMLAKLEQLKASPVLFGKFKSSYLDVQKPETIEERTARKASRTQVGNVSASSDESAGPSTVAGTTSGQTPPMATQPVQTFAVAQELRKSELKAFVNAIQNISDETRKILMNIVMGAGINEPIGQIYDRLNATMKNIQPTQVPAATFANTATVNDGPGSIPGDQQAIHPTLLAQMVATDMAIDSSQNANPTAEMASFAAAPVTAEVNTYNQNQANAIPAPTPTTATAVPPGAHQVSPTPTVAAGTPVPPTPSLAAMTPNKPLPTPWIGGEPGYLNIVDKSLNRSDLQKIRDNVEEIKDIDLLTPEGQHYLKQQLAEQKKIADWIRRQTPRIPYQVQAAAARDQVERNKDKYLVTENQRRWLEYSRSVLKNNKLFPA